MKNEEHTLILLEGGQIMNDIISQLSDMKAGQELISEMSVLPLYDENIRSQSTTSRLIALSELYNIYIPSPMSVEIYSKLYLALLRSLQKKSSRNARIQQNENYKYICQKDCNGILGGADSFTITGNSGIGKSSAITRAIDLITAKGVIEVEKPYTKIIHCLVVQCPFDCSVKGLLLEILRKVDEILNSDYYSKALKSRVTTDMLIGCVSQVSLNHIGLLIVDEIQNVVNSKNGKSLVGMLTQLINNSGVSIGMVGTPESVIFFEQALQLARRSLGLHYGASEYNQYFYDFCKTLFKYQYTEHKTDISDSVVRWLYEHSGGILSVVVSLIHDSQEIAILNGIEKINFQTLNEAYEKRLSMVHGYIEPTITRKSQTSSRKQKADEFIISIETETNTEKIISSVVTAAKEKGVDVVGLLQEKITVEVIKV